MIHLNKKRGILKEIINISDVILEVADARMPKDTRIKSLENIIKKRNKNLIIVLNKSDLVPEDFIETVREDFSKEFPTVYVSSKTRKGSKTLRRYIKDFSPEKEKVYIGVIGYPNTGKSSLINMLVGRKRARTAPIPGFTKSIQLIKLSKKHYLIDTPGIIIPKDENFLAILGAKRPEKLKHPERAIELLLSKLPKYFLKKHYNIEFTDINDFLEKIAEKFNYKDQDKLRKAAIKILDDWIKGKIKGYWY